MVTYTKSNTHAVNSFQRLSPSSSTPNVIASLDPKLSLVKNFTDRGEYERALELLTKQPTAPEVLNCRGVCLLRMKKFESALSPLRIVALNSSINHVHKHVASHIKLNFAIALFFGGHPGGGLETLSEAEFSELDPTVQILRRQTKLWVQQMSLFQRVDWYLNRIAPKQGPKAPDEPMGRFVWDLESSH